MIPIKTAKNSGRSSPSASAPERKNALAIMKRDWTRNKYCYFMILPVLAFYVIFHYAPMYGAIIAFKNFQPAKGILDSPWIGIKHFVDFFTGVYFTRILSNTLVISLLSIAFAFTAPIILALLLNEVRVSWFKRSVQTITYIPHFVSMVVVCGLINEFVSSNGFIFHLLAPLGLARGSYLQEPGLFRPIYIISEVWQQCGWGSIVYLAALTNIDQEQYEAATIDGAQRLQKLWHITLPNLIPTVVILFILRLGNVMNVGFEKIILLYNPSTYVTADVISSFVYRKGLQEMNYSASAAVGLFNSVVNFTVLLAANTLSRKLSENENSLF